MLKIKQLNIIFAFNPAIGAYTGDFRLNSASLCTFYLACGHKFKLNPFWNKMSRAIFGTPFNDIGTSVAFHAQSDRFGHKPTIHAFIHSRKAIFETCQNIRRRKSTYTCHNGRFLLLFLGFTPIRRFQLSALDSYCKKCYRSFSIP